MSEPSPAPADTRPYSPGLEGVIAGETTLCFIDGERGRLLYRGYRDRRHRRARYLRGDREPAVDRRVGPGRQLPCPDPGRGHDHPARPAHRRTKPMDALRTAVSAWGADTGPAVAADRRAGPRAHLVLAVGARGVRAAARRASSRSSPIPSLDLVEGFLYQLNGVRPDAGTARPSTRTSSSAPSTASTPRRSRPGSSPRRARTSRRPCRGAIGTMKGPLHGGAPSEVVDQLSQVGSADHAEAWVREALGTASG